MPDAVVCKVIVWPLETVVFAMAVVMVPVVGSSDGVVVMVTPLTVKVAVEAATPVGIGCPIDCASNVAAITVSLLSHSMLLDPCWPGSQQKKAYGAWPEVVEFHNTQLESAQNGVTWMASRQLSSGHITC